MAARKRVQKNTIQGKIEAMKSVREVLTSPIQLDPDEQKYFDYVVMAREVSSWDNNSLLIAANLAMSYAQLDEANLVIAEVGLMTKSDKGTPVVNPAITAKTALSNSILQMNRILGLSASQNGLSGQKQAARNKADAEARAVISQVKDDGLLA
jgi:phage terminase small subunit